MSLKFGSLLQSSGRPILITGHTGFKGTWATLLLEKLNIAVVGFSLHATPDSLYQELNRENKIPEVFGDIRDRELLREAIQKFQPVAILHLAAQALVLESYKSPVQTFDINVQGTVNLLDAALDNKNILSIGIVTTDKVYENLNKGIRFKVHDSLKGNDPYSASKVAAESAIAAWQQLSKINVGPSIFSLRAGNVIGGGDLGQDRLFPDIINSIRNKTVLQIRNPESTRPWQHVLDPIAGYIQAIEYGIQGVNYGAYNFGPSEPSLSVREAIEYANRFWKKSSLEIEFEETSAISRESHYLEIDSTLSSDELQWHPSWNQQESIAATMKWWESVLYGSSTKIEACNRDIEFKIEKLKA